MFRCVPFVPPWESHGAGTPLQSLSVHQLSRSRHGGTFSCAGRITESDSLGRNQSQASSAGGTQTTGPYLLAGLEGEWSTAQFLGKFKITWPLSSYLHLQPPLLYLFPWLRIFLLLNSKFLTRNCHIGTSGHCVPLLAAAPPLSDYPSVGGWWMGLSSSHAHQRTHARNRETHFTGLKWKEKNISTLKPKTTWRQFLVTFARVLPPKKQTIRR